MTFRTRAAQLLGAVALITASSAVASPANADSVTVPDPADATGSNNDIRSVSLRYDDARVKWTVTFTDLRRKSPAAGATVYLDSDLMLRGPEHQVRTGLAFGTDYQLLRSDVWDRAYGEPRGCPHHVRLDYRADTMSGWVARRCLDKPDAVRIAVKMTDAYDGSHPVSDWMRGYRKWSPAVTRG